MDKYKAEIEVLRTQNAGVENQVLDLKKQFVSYKAQFGKFLEIPEGQSKPTLYLMCDKLEAAASAQNKIAQLQRDLMEARKSAVLFGQYARNAKGTIDRLQSERHAFNMNNEQMKRFQDTIARLTKDRNDWKTMAEGWVSLTKPQSQIHPASIKDVLASYAPTTANSTTPGNHVRAVQAEHTTELLQKYQKLPVQMHQAGQVGQFGQMVQAGQVHPIGGNGSEHQDLEARLGYVQPNRVPSHCSQSNNIQHQPNQVNQKMHYHQQSQQQSFQDQAYLSQLHGHQTPQLQAHQPYHNQAQHNQLQSNQLQQNFLMPTPISPDGNDNVIDLTVEQPVLALPTPATTPMARNISSTSTDSISEMAAASSPMSEISSVGSKTSRPNNVPKPRPFSQYMKMNDGSDPIQRKIEERRLAAVAKKQQRGKKPNATDKMIRAADQAAARQRMKEGKARAALAATSNIVGVERENELATEAEKELAMAIENDLAMAVENDMAMAIEDDLAKAIEDDLAKAVEEACTNGEDGAENASKEWTDEDSKRLSAALTAELKKDVVNNDDGLDYLFEE